MQSSNKITLVLGGSGKTGRKVAERLAHRGIATRIGSRSAQPAFDWEDPGTWPLALQDTESVYVTYQPDLAFPGAAENVNSFTKLAVESGVQRIVLLSGRGEEGALLSEKAVQDSGVEWTIVRASFFCQNFSEGSLLEPLLTGEFAFPAGNVQEPFIDTDDIADTATAALTDGRHAGKIYEVTGPRLLTFAEAVQEIAKATGREIRYLPVSLDQYLAALLEHGVPADFATPLVALFASVLDGRNASLTDGVQRALGRQPKDFSDYVRETAATDVWVPSATVGARL
ncbi:MAG: NAD(P)H-binding protein [Bryobacteraceae bacterium]|nr:NAD(P)H-binding protein [Bryobacteraceae bacterium]